MILGLFTGFAHGATCRTSTLREKPLSLSPLDVFLMVIRKKTYINKIMPHKSYVCFRQIVFSVNSENVLVDFMRLFYETQWMSNKICCCLFFIILKTSSFIRDANPDSSSKCQNLVSFTLICLNLAYVSLEAFFCHSLKT